MLPARKIVLAAACAAACACLSACGGGGDNENTLDGQNPPPPPTRYFSIGGAVDSAFTGKLVLEDQYPVNGATRTDRVTLSSSGAFQVSSQVPQGDSYQVSVATQPPDQYCTVAQGSGTAQAAVSNVAVTCAAGTESLLAALPGSPSPNQFGVPLLASNGDIYESAYNGGAHTNGAIVQITPSGQVSELYSFAGGTSDGAGPNQTLVQGPNGDLYGVTNVGGPNNVGSIFELTLNGSEKVLHFFAGGTTDGANPSSALLLASDGNFYGVTSGGGANGAGTLYRISPAGAYTLLYSFPANASAALTLPEGALIQASDGELVGTCYDGGAGNNGGVFTFDPKTGTKIDLAQAGTTFAGPQFGVIQASDGNYYGLADYTGNELFKVTPSGTASVVYNFNTGISGALAGAVGPLVQASDGELYGSAGSGGASGGGGVFRVDPATGTLTTVHAFSNATGSLDYGPLNGLVLGSNGWLYGLFGSPAPGGVFTVD